MFGLLQHNNSKYMKQQHIYLEASFSRSDRLVTHELKKVSFKTLTFQYSFGKIYLRYNCTFGCVNNTLYFGDIPHDKVLSQPSMKSCHTNFPVTLALILILNYFIVNIVQRHQNKAMIASISRIHKALCKAMSNPQYLLLNHCYCIGNPDMQGVFDICV